MTNLDAKTKALELAIEFHKNQKTATTTIILQTAERFVAFLLSGTK